MGNIVSEELTSSLEDYLESIYLIISEKEAVRPKDIAKRLNVSNASVTGALKTLSDKGMINYAPYDVITLTNTGRIAAMDILRRHELLKDFFTNVLGVSKDEADKAACAMEHGISTEVLDKLAKFAEFIELCPRGGTEWANGKLNHCDKAISLEVCQNCITSISDKVQENYSRQLEGGRIMKKLNDVQPGERCKIIKITSKGTLFKRITEMGLTAGTIIEVERVAPLGDPVEMKVKGYHLSLRKDEASKIEVEMI